METTNHESGANLTPSEIAEIEKKAEAYQRELIREAFSGMDAEMIAVRSEQVAQETGNKAKGYFAAKLEDAAEIKRLRAEVAELKLFIKTNLQ